MSRALRRGVATGGFMTMTFDDAEKSPRYAELMAFAPDTSGQNLGLMLLIGFLAIFSAMATVMTFLFLLGGPLALVPMSMALLGGYGFIRALGALRKFNAAPIERVVAVVRDETVEARLVTETTHDHHHAGHHHERTTTRVRHDHYVVLELKSGDRESYGVSAELARLVVKGDVGVAYLKAGVLLDFKPL